MVKKQLVQLIKYDFLVFLREPFFALPIMILPGIFFYVFMSIFGAKSDSLAGFEIYIPTYALLISFLVLFFNIGIQFVTEKESGIHKRLVLSSITKKHIIVAYLIRGVTLSLLGLLEIMLIAILAFDMSPSKYFFSFTIVFLLIVGLLLLISLSVHDLFKTTKQVLPFTIISFQYVLFCSGLMFPPESSPMVIKFLIYINPFYHMNNILVNMWSGHWEKTDFLSICYLLLISGLCLLLIKFNSRRKIS